MPRFALSIVAALAASSALLAPCRAEDAESPIYKSWASHKVGTSITLKTVNGSGPRAVTSLETQTLKDATPEKVVLEILVTQTADGITRQQPAKEFVYKKKFPLLPGVKKEDIGKPSGRSESGEETIKAAGMEFKAQWYISKSQTEAGEAVSRTWMSDEVPGKLIKSIDEVAAAKSTSTTELIEFKTP